MNNRLPTAATGRSLLLDSLRGLALLGIFLNNCLTFSGIAYLTEAEKAKIPAHASGEFWQSLEVIFVEGKFYTLFSLLFGIGFSIMLQRSSEKGASANKLFYRRLTILALFGFLHLTFLWDGDILLLYALIGCLLPLFRNWSDRALLRTAVILILFPVLVDVFRCLLKFNPGDALFAIAQKLDKKNGIPTDDSFAHYLYQPGSGYAAALKWYQSGFFYRFQYILDSNRVFKVLGIFLLGFYMGRRQLYLKLEENRALLQKTFRLGVLVGLPVSILFWYFGTDGKAVPRSWMGLADTGCYALSVVPLALAYAAGIALLWLRPAAASWIRLLAPAGQMALSNYIMQSVLGVLIFYEMGLGLGNELAYGWIILLALAIFLIQLLLSYSWLRYFNFGPLEWIWRQLTYLKQFPLRRSHN